MPGALDRPELSARVGFAANHLDRLTERREEPGLIAELITQPQSRIVLLTAPDSSICFRSLPESEVLFRIAEAESLGSLEEIVLLGQDGDRAIFSALLRPRDDLANAGVQTLNLRSLATQDLVGPERLGILAQAKSVVDWHGRNRFCANCGSVTQSLAAGWRRQCPSCAAAHFPRVDPVVIMAAVDGDFCLLGRQARFAPGLYSALAGFVEPGETIEDAVRREVLEETGVAIGAVQYVASQPWPFPSSLMIACFASALTREIRLDETELQDARWVSRSELRAMFAQSHPEGLRAPTKVAIAHVLLDAWLND